MLHHVITSYSIHYTKLYDEFTTDSCGAGKFRGGCGAGYRIKMYDEEPNLVMFGDGRDIV